MTKAPSFVKAHKAEVPEDSLLKLRELAKAARTLELEIANLEERLKEHNIKLYDLTTKTLPDLMAELRIPSITIDAEGNEPAYELKAVPFYRANIAAEWPPEKKAAAFAWLDENGHGDLIKTTVGVPFAREDRAKAKKLADKLSKDYGVTLTENVHFMTLTAWLKEQVEDKQFIPPLDTIGGQVGRIVKIKER